MPSEKILLTGATGFVGFRILEEALKQGFHLRLAIRSESKVTEITEALSKNSFDDPKLEFVTVPDMATEDAFNEAVQGVDYIIHVASPLPTPSQDLETTIIKPAVNVTLAMLKSAMKAESVKKVVITSSVAAVAPSKPAVFDANNIEPDPEGPWTNPFYAYAGSKKLALNAARNFIARENPAFSVIHIMPSFVIGRNDFARSREDYLTGSNQIALAPLLGTNLPQPRPGSACHVDDVAAVHLAVLKPAVEGHRNFGVTFDGLRGIDWNAAPDIVKQKAPDLLEGGLFPMGGNVESQKIPFDATQTERELGIKFKSFEEMVVDVARAYAGIGS